MDSTKLDVLDLNPKLQEAVKKANIVTCSDVIKLSPQEICILTGLSENSAKKLLRTVSKAILSGEFVTASQLKERKVPKYNRSRLSLGCPILDSFFEGGLLTGTITEITGESSSGKTQLCLQLSIRAQLPVEDGGLNSEVAYICTEEKFPFKRFEQLVGNVINKNQDYRSINFNDNVSISHIKSIQQLLLCFREAVPQLLKKNIKLFIIDSVASILRCEYEPGEITRRTNDMQCLGREIWKLANVHKIAVVCVNQVAAAFNRMGYSSSKGDVVPTLGLLWANVLTTRVMVARTNREVNTEPYNTCTVRSMKILFSPYLPNSECSYIIAANGVIGMST